MTYRENTLHAQLVFAYPILNELSHPRSLLRPDVSAALRFLVLRIHAAPIIHNQRIHDVKQLLQYRIVGLVRAGRFGQLQAFLQFLDFFRFARVVHDQLLHCEGFWFAVADLSPL